jgi:predicted DNA-binding transcriptional regulator AlpA
MDGMDRLLTAAEVAQRLGYTERYVWPLGREGVLPRVKVPGRKYVRSCESDVERFAATNRQGARVPVVPARSRPIAVVPSRLF